MARILGREKTYGRQIAPRHWTVGFKLEIVSEDDKSHHAIGPWHGRRYHGVYAVTRR